MAALRNNKIPVRRNYHVAETRLSREYDKFEEQAFIRESLLKKRSIEP